MVQRDISGSAYGKHRAMSMAIIRGQLSEAVKANDQLYNRLVSLPISRSGSKTHIETVAESPLGGKTVL